MAKKDREYKPSAAKAAVAMQKPRDASGRFLSGAELQAYQAQQQAAQFAAERARVNNILGRSSDVPISQTPTQQMSGPTGFGSKEQLSAILQANKPHGMASDLEEADKWNMLLGKRRRL